MEKHTPGPWFTVNQGGGEFDVDSALHHIASVSCHPPESDGNARLIAAAPELLEALISISEHSQEFGDIEDFERQVFEMTRKAKEAIRKATGEE